MNAPPPCAAAWPGNRRKFPSPTADPETARMTPTRVPHSICFFFGAHMRNFCGPSVLLAGFEVGEVIFHSRSLL